MLASSPRSSCPCSRQHHDHLGPGADAVFSACGGATGCGFGFEHDSELVDALTAAMFRLSVPELAQLEARKHGFVGDLPGFGMGDARAASLWGGLDDDGFGGRSALDAFGAKRTSFHQAACSQVAGYKEFDQDSSLFWSKHGAETARMRHSTRPDSSESGARNLSASAASKKHKAHNSKDVSGPSVFFVDADDSLEIDKMKKSSAKTQRSAHSSWVKKLPAGDHAHEPIDMSDPLGAFEMGFADEGRSNGPRLVAARGTTTNKRGNLSAPKKRTPLGHSAHLDEDEPIAIPLNVCKPAFKWKGVDALLDGVTEEQVQRQLISVHRLVSNRDRLSLAALARGVADVDLSLPLRGVTALSLALRLGYTDVTRDLLMHMARLGQIARAVNVMSVDNTWRRETPLITAARTGQTDCVSLLIRFGGAALDVEARDAQGKTALWHAVREEHYAIMRVLVERAGAKVYYENEDIACPLQLACKTALLRHKGRQTVRYLVSHGSNLEYLDLALRNALYWALYNGCGDTIVFLLEAGARVLPWSYLANDALPASLAESPARLAYVRAARDGPPKLRTLALAAYRNWLISVAHGRSIYPLLQLLHLTDQQRAIVRLENIRPLGAIKAHNVGGELGGKSKLK